MSNLIGSKNSESGALSPAAQKKESMTLIDANSMTVFLLNSLRVLIGKKINHQIQTKPLLCVYCVRKLMENIEHILRVISRP